MTKRTKYQHILKEDVTLDAAPFSTIPKGTPIFCEEQNGFIVFQFGEYKRQVLKKHFYTEMGLTVKKLAPVLDKIKKYNSEI